MFYIAETFPNTFVYFALPHILLFSPSRRFLYSSGVFRYQVLGHHLNILVFWAISGVNVEIKSVIKVHGGREQQ